MKRLTFITTILAIMLTFLACGNKSRQVESTTLKERDYYNIDSLPSMDKSDEGKYDNIPSPSDDGRHLPHHGSNFDNMRGFDPASEDDMDDNGMQRYFDANDDEAWD